jgi:hypothetical protein
MYSTWPRTSFFPIFLEAPAGARSGILFTFSGNPPDALLTASLQAYPGPVNQWGIGLHVEGHAAFIGAVYDRVIADANNA